MLISSKFIYVWVSIALCFNEIIAKRNSFMKSKGSKIAHNFPYHTDLRFYLISLERIIHFSYEFRDDLDLNFKAGLFLVNVNLKPFTKDDNLPEPLRNYLKSLLFMNHKALDFYDKHSDDNNNHVNLKISSFFYNVTLWSRRLMALNLNSPNGKRFQIGRNHHEYSDWSTYVQNVDDIDNSEPSPQLSDKCMAYLAENQENLSEYSKCRVPEDCYKMLLVGTNFGYGLTHRLLFLLFAHFGRGCAIFSTAQDETMRQRFCEMIHTEAEYIASNEYKHVDLMFEQIALCALAGNAEFLHRTWFYNLLRYQTPHGCFGQRLPEGNVPTSNPRYSTFGQRLTLDREVNWKHDLMNGTCNSHVTAVAAASIAAAVRLILENY